MEHLRLRLVQRKSDRIPVIPGRRAPAVLVGDWHVDQGQRGGHARTTHQNRVSPDRRRSGIGLYIVSAAVLFDRDGPRGPEHAASMLIVGALLYAHWRREDSYSFH